jgi:diguanylate cyclase (GGDEF)-like protein
MAEYEATHDPLTGLTNRRALMDRLQSVLDDAIGPESCALLYCDVDNMKMINDGLGHHVGDMALQTLASRMTEIARLDDLVTRVGGDEFILMFSGSMDSADLEAIADRMIDECSRPMTVDGEEFSLSISAGIAVSENDDTIVRLMQRADAALYEAKRTGRNRWVAYSDHMRRATGEALRLREDIRRGIAAQEFCVEYQPIVALSRGSVIAHEALVRWNHPVDGMRLPGTFIAVAEETGLIQEIDRAVFDIVVADLAAERLDTPVTVNVSAVHLGDVSAMNRIHEALEIHPLLRHRIWLEITETALPGLVDTALEQLIRLDAAGVRLVLDDFGTGFASLYYLAQAPISVIKIDQSLTHVTGANGKAAGLLGWIRTLGNDLGLMVIAEGIETQEQQAWIRGLGIDYGQGWMLGRPAAVLQ